MSKALSSLRLKPLARAISCSALLTLTGALTPILVYADQTQGSQAQPASQQVKSYEIPAGPLSQVLSQFAGIAGVAISFDAAEFNNLSSSGLQGSYTVEQGFAELLAGTGQTAVRQPNGDYVLQSGGGTVTLPALTVSGSAMMGATTEETGSYTTGSTNTATKLQTTPRYTPQIVNSVTHQMIQDFAMQDMEDVMNMAPGVSVSVNGQLN